MFSTPVSSLDISLHISRSSLLFIGIDRLEGRTQMHFNQKLVFTGFCTVSSSFPEQAPSSHKINVSDDISSCPSRDTRTLWLCLDKFGPSSRPLDCPAHLLFYDWYCQCKFKGKQIHPRLHHQLKRSSSSQYSIYMATIDYMIASYGPFSASATGGNALARDFLAGVAAMYATPFYSNLPKPYTLEYPTTILACIALLVTIPIYIFYWKGPYIRERSKFAQTLASDKKANAGAGGANKEVSREADHLEA